jgi:hypothetical protein
LVFSENFPGEWLQVFHPGLLHRTSKFSTRGHRAISIRCYIIWSVVK